MAPHIFCCRPWWGWKRASSRRPTVDHPPALTFTQLTCLWIPPTPHLQERSSLLTANIGFDDIVLNASKPSCIVGRSRNADYNLTHPQISGLQCTLSLDFASNRLLLTDTSTNGTSVDGAVIGKGQSRELREGAKVSFLGPEEIDMVPIFCTSVTHFPPAPASRPSRSLPTAAASPALPPSAVKTLAEGPLRRVRRRRPNDRVLEPAIRRLSPELLALISQHLDSRRCRWP